MMQENLVNPFLKQNPFTIRNKFQSLYSSENAKNFRHRLKSFQQHRYIYKKSNYIDPKYDHLKLNLQYLWDTKLKFKQPISKLTTSKNLEKYQVNYENTSQSTIKDQLQKKQSNHTNERCSLKYSNCSEQSKHISHQSYYRKSLMESKVSSQSKFEQKNINEVNKIEQSNNINQIKQICINGKLYYANQVIMI